MSKRKPPTLSPAAARLYRRLCNGAWFPCYSNRTPQAMNELLSAGLVGRMGRVHKVTVCYVPIGAKNFRLEAIPGAPKWLQ